MPPAPPAKKAKVKQVKDEGSASTMLLDYLLKQNRPFNANDLFANMHEAISKTVLAKALVKMSEEKTVIEKTYGKQKIYFASQSDQPKLSNEELDALDNELTARKEELATITARCSELDAELAKLTADPTTEDADTHLASLIAEAEKKEARLATVRGGGQLMTEADRKRINNEYSKQLKLWRQRKRMVKDILDQIMEGYPKSKEDLHEAVGLETDEEAGVDMATFEAV